MRQLRDLSSKFYKVGYFNTISERKVYKLIRPIVRHYGSAAISINCSNCDMIKIMQIEFPPEDNCP